MIAARHRNSSAATAAPSGPPIADIQAALTALTRPTSRRHVEWSQRIDLSGLNLFGADFRGANLKGVDLSWADLRSADFRKANLAHANLTGADLRGARFRAANLELAKLEEADLRGAIFLVARLRWARLNGADLRGANLWMADFGEVEGLLPEQFLPSVGYVKRLPAEVEANPEVATRMRAEARLWYSSDPKVVAKMRAQIRDWL